VAINNTTGSDFEDAFGSASADVEANPSTGSQFDHPERVMPTEAVFDDGPGEVDEVDDVDDDTEDDPQSVGDNGSDVFDWTNHKDSLVTVKVNGTEVEVPLGEALNGYLRQEDYTRKTQSLAEDRKYSDWAKSLQVALEENPFNVVKSLADAYKIPLNDNFGSEEDLYANDDPEFRKLLERDKQREAQLARMQEEIDRVQQDRIMVEVKAELAQVQAMYADFDPEKVLPVALERGLNIEDAYLYNKGREAATTGKQAAQIEKKAAEKAALEATKRANQKKISRPNGITSGGRNVSEADRSFDSFADMFADALNSKH
jgi:hypothetical protein